MWQNFFDSDRKEGLQLPNGGFQDGPDLQKIVVLQWKEYVVPCVPAKSKVHDAFSRPQSRSRYVYLLVVVFVVAVVVAVVVFSGLGFYFGKDPISKVGAKIFVDGKGVPVQAHNAVAFQDFHRFM